MKRDYFIMQILRIDGQCIGTGWTGKKMKAKYIGNADAMVKQLRRFKLIKGTRNSSISIGQYGDEFMVEIKGKEEFYIQNDAQLTQKIFLIIFF